MGWHSNSESSGSPAQIQSVSRASRLLLWIANQRDGARAIEASLALGLMLPTTHHLLATLVAEGLLARTDGRRYVLGPAVGALALCYQRDGAVPANLVNTLRGLAEDSGETSYLAAWRRDEIEMLATMESRNALRVGWIPVGLYQEAHARAVGKVLLAFAPVALRDSYLAMHPPGPVTPATLWRPDEVHKELARVRSVGYAHDREEYIEGVSCVAAPINQHGVLIGAFGLSAPADRFRRNVDRLTTLTVAAAASVSRSIDTQKTA